MDTTPERPRRLHDARICPDCLQEFPDGRGYQGHDCPGRPQRTVAELPDDGSMDKDIEQIRKSGPIRADVIAAWDHVKPLLIAAWQHGYTTGMADAAKIEEAVGEPGNEIGHHRFFAAKELGLTWNPMKQTFE